MGGGRQFALFCSCGAALPCRRCIQRRADSRRRFAGHREVVLARDHSRCLACGAAPARLHVHHRRPGIHDRRWLATVCPACHARLHRLGAVRKRWLPPPLIKLWAEQHPGQPVQLQLFAETAARYNAL